VREFELGLPPQIAEDVNVLLAPGAEHGVEDLGVLRVDGELPASLAGPGLSYAGQAHDDAREPPEFLPEPYRPRPRRVRALEDPRVAVGDVRVTAAEHGGGAVIAALRIAPPWAVSASVGDCRVYRYRRGEGAPDSGANAHRGVLARLTRDDVLWLDMLRAGGTLEAAKETRNAHRHVVTRGLGLRENVDVNLQYTSLEDGDLYLLCSDGVTAQLTDDEIRGCVADADLPLAARFYVLPIVASGSYARPTSAVARTT
jgi:hypothetical protein